ncbi:hypothetical protein OVA12_05950 [Pannonibacter sp. SL95]|nr:hypothetical protein [Pannonibacter sp. SL95]MCY1705569.1 hypothetical protein [Pannonibacter sp. SL95]
MQAIDETGEDKERCGQQIEHQRQPVPLPGRKAEQDAIGGQTCNGEAGEPEPEPRTADADGRCGDEQDIGHGRHKRRFARGDQQRHGVAGGDAQPGQCRPVQQRREHGEHRNGPERDKGRCRTKQAVERVGGIKIGKQRQAAGGRQRRRNVGGLKAWNGEDTRPAPGELARCHQAKPEDCPEKDPHLRTEEIVVDRIFDEEHAADGQSDAPGPDSPLATNLAFPVDGGFGRWFHRLCLRGLVAASQMGKGTGHGCRFAGLAVFIRIGGNACTGGHVCRYGISLGRCGVRGSRLRRNRRRYTSGQRQFKARNAVLQFGDTQIEHYGKDKGNEAQDQADNRQHRQLVHVVPFGVSAVRGTLTSRVLQDAAARCHGRREGHFYSSWHGSTMASMPRPGVPALASVWTAGRVPCCWSVRTERERHGCHDQVMA